MRTTELGNNVLSLEFDNRTGSLVQIEDRRAGCRHLKDPAHGRLFRLIVPDDGPNGKWSDRYCDSFENDPPEIRVHGDTATIHFPNLKFAVTGAPSGIAATAIVRLPADADEALFSLEVVNHGAALIHEVWYPQVGGWTGYSGPEQDKIAVGVFPQEPAFFERKGFSSGYTLGNKHRRKFWGLPLMAFPMIDVSDGKRGLSYICRLREYQSGGIVFEDLNPRKGAKAGMRPSWSWVHYPFLKPGARWTSPSVGIAPHNGDWRQTADRLRRWLQSWWQAPGAPDRLRDAIGFFSLYCRDFMGLERVPLAEMPKVAAYAKAHGLEDLGIWDVMESIYCRPDTRGFFEEEPARLAQWKSVLAEIRSAGVHPHPLVNARLTLKTNKLWQGFHEKLTAKSLYGQEMIRESWPVSSNGAQVINPEIEQGGVALCQSDRNFQKFALELVDKAQELGFTSYFIDQAFEGHQCFDPSHAHTTTPAHLHAGVLEWIPEVARKIRRRDPDGCVVGENTDIWNSQFIDIAWNWGWADWANERYRYVLPDSIQAWTIDAFEHEDQVGKAFAMGFLLAVIVEGMVKRLEDVPEFARRIKRLSDLRKKTAAFTVRGRFRHHDGLAFETPASVAVSVYEATDSLGVALGETAPYGADGGGAVDLTLDLSCFGFTRLGKVRLHREDGTAEDLPFRMDGEKLRLQVALQRWECAVVELR